MRKYRAKQRSDPIKYQQYLERERMRNYKRKYEQRIEAAQKRAQELGIPYIVLNPPHVRRGRKPMFGDVSLVLPAKFKNDFEDESNSFNSDDMPVKVELHELEDRKPQISVVNINKLISQPRSALQTLLPQEVNDRERASNFIKLEHDYVKQEKISMHDGESRKRSGKNRRKMNKNDLLQLQKQCRSFILDRVTANDLPKRKRSRRTRQRPVPPEQPTSHFERRNSVEHEDLDDLFKELAEVANKEPPPKKKHSSSHHKYSSTKRSPRKQSVLKDHGDDGQFSLTVSMPVQPIVTSPMNRVNIKDERKSPTHPYIGYVAEDDKIAIIRNDNSEVLKSSVNNTVDVFKCIEEPCENIKQEPIYSDDDFF